jgi:hypothetical protein
VGDISGVSVPPAWRDWKGAVEPLLGGDSWRGKDWGTLVATLCAGSTPSSPVLEWHSCGWMCREHVKVVACTAIVVSTTCTENTLVVSCGAMVHSCVFVPYSLQGGESNSAGAGGGAGAGVGVGLGAGACAGLGAGAGLAGEDAVRAFLRDHQLDAYAGALIADGFDTMERLVSVTEQDLDDIEVGSSDTGSCVFSAHQLDSSSLTLLSLTCLVCR